MVMQRADNIASALASQWLEGSIRHRRKSPVGHEFSYHTGMLALNLGEWDRVTRISRLFSLERFNWLSLYRKDYFAPDSGDLLEAVRRQVRQATGWQPDGAVELITHPRYLGYVFNPVSFYFCYASGDRPERSGSFSPRSPIPPGMSATSIAWKPPGKPKPGRAGARSGSVSASASMYRRSMAWISITNGPSVSPELGIHMNVLEGGHKQFDATLVVQRTPLTRKQLHRSLRRFPLEALKVAGGIYWHALKLKLKGAPFYSHPDKLRNSDPAYRLGHSDTGLDVTETNNTEKTSGRVSSWRT